jgi:alcohol dehydrogenase YqhD (iron-dependent ADH family)
MDTPRKTFISDEINEAVMRNTIRNIREVIKNSEDVEARSELMWTSAMAENSLLKLGKASFFQAHQIEHQLGAYTDCNHGQGLAVIHPVLYKHIYKGDTDKFTRFANAVWDKETAEDGIQALADFIKEIGLPTSFKEMGISKDCFEAVAKSTNIDPYSAKVLTADEIFEILNECL